MTVTDNTKDDLALFSALSEGDAFKDSSANSMMKTADGGSGENAVNLSTGALSTVADSTMVNRVNASVTLEWYTSS